ncbi:Basic leucine zipper 61, partial [Cucurbita argyrosperma subsp. sororia]
MDTFHMRMAQPAGIPAILRPLPPLPRSRLGKPTPTTAGDKLHLFQSNGNDKIFLSGGEPTPPPPLNEHRLQLPDSDKDVNVEARRLRRVMQSRQYSQKYRLKQLHYITQLESELKALQAEVTITSPRIKFMDRQNSLLRAENYSIKEKLSSYAGELLFKEAQYEELKRERNMLKEMYEAYQLKRLETLKNSSSSKNNNNSTSGGVGGSSFQLEENCPEMADKSNPFRMLEN